MAYQKEFTNIDGHIEFQDVEFTYSFNDRDPISQVDMDNNQENTDAETDFKFGSVNCNIDKGDTVGLVGPSGSGKTTFIKLLMRFVDPNTGQINIDGGDISEYNPRTLRDRIGYVEQDPYIFNSSIRSNIKYGNTEATEEQILEALEQAALRDEIEKMENGIDTIIGEDGGKLSGGQKQRIAIARAIIGNPSMLVLDEATSHVDNITESKIQKSIDKATQDRTTFIIAHRLSTVRNADEILVMEDGNIVEQGSHEELVELSGLYDRLWSKHIGLK